MLLRFKTHPVEWDVECFKIEYEEYTRPTRRDKHRVAFKLSGSMLPQKVFYRS